METDRLIYAAFGETALPLMDALDLQFSLRYEDYGNNGGASLDPKAALRWQAGPSLALRLSAGTRTLSWKIDAWQFGPAYDAAGRLNYDTSLARSVVKWKGQAYVNLHTERVNLRWTAHYTGAYRHDLDSEPRIRAHNTHDLVAAFTTLGGKLTLDAALLNVTDREPPRVYRQINYDPVTHNPLGRVFQVGVRWRL